MFANILSRYWWMTLLRGLFWLVFGIVVITIPGMSLLSLALFLGITIFADGILNVVNAFGGRKEHENWWVLLLAGLAGIGIGALMFLRPDVTALALVFYIAIWAIAAGLLQIVGAVRLRKEIQGEFWLGLAGLASVALGGLLLANPAAGALAMLSVIGAFAIVIGVVLILLAFKVRAFAKQIAAAVRT
jgi:uncharacterized membrane protein HdeD (DUF308 family)